MTWKPIPPIRGLDGHINPRYVAYLLDIIEQQYQQLQRMREIVKSLQAGRVPEKDT